MVLRVVKHLLQDSDMLIMSWEMAHTIAKSLGIAPKGVVVSSDQDPQEPDSQSESTIITGQVTQEPSIQSMDAYKDSSLSVIQTNPDNAQGSLSLTDRELGMQLIIYSAASTLVGIGQDTQEPPVQSTGEVPYVQVTQEPFVQSTEEHLRIDATHVLIEPISTRPMETTNSGMSSDTLSLISASMIIDSSLYKEPTIYLTTDNPSLSISFFFYIE